MRLKDRLFAHKSKKETVQILIPDESFDLVESTDSEGAKALMVIDATLKLHKDDIPLKQVFGYYCSIIFDYNDVDDNLWPTPEEFSIMQDYVETFDKAGRVLGPQVLLAYFLREQQGLAVMRALNLSSLIIPISGVLSKTDMICYEGRCIRHIFLVGIPNHNLGVYPRNLLKAMRKMSFWKNKL